MPKNPQMYRSPLQGFLKQGFDSESGPYVSHSWPPAEATGFEQDLQRVRNPGPHLASQSVHLPQFV